MAEDSNHVLGTFSIEISPLLLISVLVIANEVRDLGRKGSGNSTIPKMIQNHLLLPRKRHPKSNPLNGMTNDQLNNQQMKHKI